MAENRVFQVSIMSIFPRQDLSTVISDISKV